MKEYKCFACRDGESGFIGKCPKCGKEYHVHSEPLKDYIIEDEYSRMYVPKAYRGVAWSIDTLNMTHADITGKKSYQTYASGLEKLHSIFISGRIPKNSIFIVAPQQFSKMTFAYSCLQLAYKNGHRIFPILDTQQLKRFLALSVDKPNSPLLKQYNYTYEDLLNADIVFITVAKGYSRNAGFEIIDQVIDMRSRNDKATIVLSRFTLNDISGFDYMGRFESIINEQYVGKRYPVFIQYLDHTMRTGY